MSYIQNPSSGGGGGPSFNRAVVTSGATVGSPYSVPTNVQTVLLNKSVGAASYVQFPLASTMGTGAQAIGTLIKDLKGDADVNNITIQFTGGELCDGNTLIVVGTKYGFVTINPVPGGGAWYSS